MKHRLTPDKTAIIRKRNLSVRTEALCITDGNVNPSRQYVK